MVIEALDSNVIALIRSSSAIDSITQCVTELVLNSLDAKPTSIAVRVNLLNFRIQVVDNGKGISRPNLEFVGQRYMTNKCHSLSDLKRHISYYGFKGEALASIAKTSQRVSITSREQNCEETYCKIIEGDGSKIDLVKARPSSGTTVTVEGFLRNLPVRQQCIKSNELDNVRKSLESLIIIHPRVVFSLRNDSTGKIILDSRRSVDIAGAFKNIHPEVSEDGFTLFKVSKSKTSVDGLIHKEFHENKRLQYIYVNKRPISCPKLQNSINSTLKKVTNDSKKTQPIFVLHIKCPYSDIDLNLEPAKTVVFFKKFDLVKRCVEKLVSTLVGKEHTQRSPKKSQRNEIKSEFGLSQIGGAVKGLGMKRKSDDIEEIAPSKSPKIVEDTPIFEEPRIVTKQIKKALPIAIKRNEKKENFDCEEMHFDEVKENSLYTNFPDNERKGKDIIMDMFIKSVQVFPKDSKSCDQNSVNTPSVEELKGSPVKTDESIELTPVKENMVSIGVQTGPEIINLLEDVPLGNINDVTFCPRKPLKNFVSDYNFDFSKVETFPHVNQKFRDNFTFLDDFNQTKKLFDFRDNHSKQCNIFDGATSAQYFNENFYQRKRKDICENNDRSRPDAKLTIEKYFPKKKTAIPETKFGKIQQSPFFLRKYKEKKSILSLKRPYRSQPVENHYGISQKQSECIADDSLMETVTNLVENSNQKPLWDISEDNRRNQPLMTCSRTNNAKKKLNESFTSSYFAPQKEAFHHNHSKDLFLSNKPFSGDSTKEETTESGMVITINENDKQKIMDRDLAYQKKDDDIIPSTLTQSQNNWLKEVNMFGNTFYTNKKTGVKTFKSPKRDLSFEIGERFAFVPKGLSPILKDYGKVDSMTPESKENLQNAVIQAYEDELLVVKWQNYINNKDPKKFFEEMYIEKSKLIENAVPNVSKSASAKREIFENMKFTKEMFKSLEIIGQVDCKFIAALDKTKNLILLFDQHAVHERVRLEQLSESYKNASTKVDQNVMIFLPANDLGLIRNHKMNLYSLGLGFDIFRDGINIRQVPLCLYNKFKKGANLTTLIETLIREIIDSLKSNNGIFVNTPRLIQNIINSEACRGAIKFGDSLSKTECFIHLKQLAECTLPFQCAHGRPTLTPLISLKKFCSSSKLKVHLSVLKQI